MTLQNRLNCGLNLLRYAILGVLLASSANAAVDEITVTARKKAESLDDVPISVAAFTSEQIRERGIQNNYDVAAFTPNFNTSQRVGRDLDRPTIRGMANPSVRGEANASYFIDGVYVPRSISTATTASMERVEVLRGPQAALFGRATFSGAINYVTRKPSPNWEGELNTRLGTNGDEFPGDFQVAGWATGPIVKDLLSVLVSASWDQYDGQWRNALQPNTAFVDGSVLNFVYDGQNTEGDTSRLGREKTYDFLAKLQFTPGETTEINLKYAWTKGDDGHFIDNIFTTLNCFVPDDPAQPWYTTSTGEFCGEFKIDGTENRVNIPDLKSGLDASASPLANALPPEERFASPSEPGQRRTTQRFVGEWLQEFGAWSAQFRASFSKDTFDSTYDLDHQEVRAVWGLFNFATTRETEDSSFEFIVQSPQELRLRGSLGAYYYDYESVFRQRSIAGPLAVFGSSPGGLLGDPRDEGTSNTAVFGTLSFDLTDTLTFDFDARYAKDEKEVLGGQRLAEPNPALGLAANDPFRVFDDLEFTSFTPRFTLNWKATDETLIYLQAANGNKPGDFNFEYFRSDIPAEWTNFLVNCNVGDSLQIGGMVNMTFDCSQDLKNTITVAEEEQWTYEIGVKTNWFDRAVTTNFAAFYIDWTNQSLFALTEVPNATGSSTIINILRNAGKSRIFGVELDANWAVSDNLLLRLAYGLTDGEYTEGLNPATGETLGNNGDISGNTIPESPKHSVVLGFDARVQAAVETEAFIRGDFIYDTRRFQGASNFNWIGDRSTVNLRAGLEHLRWKLTLYARNLLNDDTPISSSEFVNFAGPVITGTGGANDGDYLRMYALNPSRQRDIGVEFSMNFGR